MCTRTNDTSISLLAHGLPSSLAKGVCALQVDSVDQVPILLGHLDEALVTEDTGVVDDDVNTSEGIEGSLDDLVTELNAVVVGNGLAASLLDLVDDQVSSASGGTLTEGRASEVVHDDLGTTGGQEESIGLALLMIETCQSTFISRYTFVDANKWQRVDTQGFLPKGNK